MVEEGRLGSEVVRGHKRENGHPCSPQPALEFEPRQGLSSQHSTELQGFLAQFHWFKIYHGYFLLSAPQPF